MDKITVAHHSLPLRTITCQIGESSFEGIMDEGSTVVAMSQSTWEAVGKPLDPTLVMHMEVANGQTSHTAGVMLNFPVIIAGLTFHLQIQVVENAPFDILLGKPFYALSRAMIFTELDGRTLVTLTDPNTHQKATVATRKRVLTSKKRFPDALSDKDF